MRRSFAIGAAMCAAGGFAAHAAPAARTPVAVGVAEREFHVTAYRKKVSPGPVTFYVRNIGQDTHNLVVSGPRGFSASTQDIVAGDRTTLSATLSRPGTYRLYCTHANHYRLGMRTTIVVKR